MLGACSNRHKSLFVRIGYIVGNCYSEVVFKDRKAFGKTNAMFSEVGVCFLDIPFEHCPVLIVCTKCTYRNLNLSFAGFTGVDGLAADHCFENLCLENLRGGTGQQIAVEQNEIRIVAGS